MRIAIAEGQGTLWFEAGTQGMVPQAQHLSIVSRLLSPLAVEKQAFAVLAVLFPGRQASHWSASWAVLYQGKLLFLSPMKFI